MSRLRPAVGPVSDTDWQTGRSAPFATHPRWWAAVRRDLLPATLEPRTVTLHGQPALRLPLGAPRNPFVIALPEHDHLSLNDVAVAAGLPIDGVGAALDALLHAPGERVGSNRAAPLAWRGMRIADDSALLQASRDAGPDRHAWRWSTRGVAATAWFELDGGTPPVPGKLRRNLNRLQRALCTEGRVEMEIHTPDDPAGLQRAFDDFLRLEASGWKGAHGGTRGAARSTAIDHDPCLRAFYGNLLDVEAPGVEVPGGAPVGERDETLRPQIVLLRLNGQAIAAKYALRTAGTLSVLKIAYDERYAHYSPGSQLLLALMNRACDTGLERLSLVTCPSWAARWHPRQAPVWHVTRYTDSAGGRALANWDRAHRGARSLLARQRARLSTLPLVARKPSKTS